MKCKYTLQASRRMPVRGWPQTVPPSLPDTTWADFVSHQYLRWTLLLFPISITKITITSSSIVRMTR